MRTEDLKVNITIPMPYEQPDGNGVVFTKESIESAISNLQTNLPILMNQDKVIGHTGRECISTWDIDKKVCYLTLLNCTLFHGGFNCDSKKKDGKVTEMNITQVGIATE